MNGNIKASQLLRSELQTVEHKVTEMNNDIIKELLEDISNYEKDFRKLVLHDINETNFLKQQVAYLNDEKCKIQESEIVLDSRIVIVEECVGFE